MSTLFKKLSPTAETDGGTETQSNTPDIPSQLAALRNDLANQQANLVAQSQETVMQTVRGMIEANLQATNKSQEKETETEAPDEFQEEMEAIGVDSAQMNGLLKTIQKYMGKHVPKIKDQIKTEVNAAKDFADAKTAINANLMEVYPDLSDTGSTFFKETQRIYQAMPEKTRINDAMSTAYAANEAARRLNVQALKLNRASVVNEDLPNGEGKTGRLKQKLNEVPPWVNDVAKSLSLNQKVFADKIQEYRNRNNK